MWGTAERAGTVDPKGKAQGRYYKYMQTPEGRMKKKTHPGSFQLCSMTEQEIKNTSLSIGTTVWIQGEPFYEDD